MITSNERRRRHLTWIALGAMVAAAICMRLFAIEVYGGQGDYLAWAQKNYFGYITPKYLQLSDELLAWGYSSLGYPPGYPALIAALRLAGIEDLQAMRVAQAVLDSAGVLFVHFLLRRAGVGLVLGLCGAAIYAVYPLWAVGSTFLLAEAVSPILMLSALALAVQWVEGEQPSRALMAASGLFLGVAALTRPDFLLLPGLLVLWFLWNRPNRRRALAAAVLLAGFSLPVFLWGLHNRVQHDHWVFATTGGGNALWEGLGALPNDYGYVLDDVKAVEVLRKQGLQWFSVEADRYFKSEYLRAWREHPEFVLRVIAWRWQRVVSDSETWLPTAKAALRLKEAFDAGGAVLALLALVAFRRSRVAVLLVGVPVAYALGSIGLTHWEARYVRYVHFSYLFALVLLLGLAAERISRLSRHAATAFLAVCCGATAWVAADAATWALEEARAARAVAAALAQPAGSGTQGGLDLCAITFAPVVPEARAGTRGCELDVVTSLQAYGYQAMAVVGVPAGSAVVARYAGQVDAGGVSIGLLAGDRSRFLAQSTHGKPGEFDGQLAGYSGRLKQVIIVVSNHNSGDLPSRATLRRLEIQCHPGSCSPGGGAR